MTDTDDYNPSEALRQIRRTYRTINTYGVSEQAGMELAIAVEDLDNFLDGGGYLPDQWRNQNRGRPRRTTDGEVLDDVRHGTRSGYNRGCHCLKCTKANREHAARRAALKKQES